VACEAVTEEDVVLVEFSQQPTATSKTSKLYLYRGRHSQVVEEFESKVLYERIINRFLNSNVFFLPDLTGRKRDSVVVQQVKQFIRERLPNQRNYEVKRAMRNFFLLAGARKRIRLFRSYESSRIWRARLSNLTNLWWLSVYNALSVLAVVVILITKVATDLTRGDFIFVSGNGFDLPTWDLWLRSFSLVLIGCAVVLGACFVVNLVFLLFPLNFPVNPNALVAMTNPLLAELHGKPVPPAPISPTSGPRPAVTSGGVMAATPSTSAGGRGFATIRMTIDPSRRTAPTPASATPSVDDASLEDLSALDYESEEDMALGVPKIKAPKRKKMVVPELESSVFKQRDVNLMETEVIVEKCMMCDQILSIPVKKSMVLSDPNPLAEISYIHGTPRHALVIQIDKTFDVRRTRSTHIIED
jgi:hypothetical protein